MIFGNSVTTKSYFSDDMHSFLEKRLNLKNGGASVSVMKEGKLVYSDTFGYSNIETKCKVSEETRFNIASVSKIFALCAVMLLVKDGKLNLDGPIYRYIPEFRMSNKDYEKITTRMLLSYTSGMEGTFLDGYEGDSYDPLYKQKFLKSLKTMNLKFIPGESVNYCNNNFVPLEILVEKISGKKYISFIKERIINPLQLKNTDVSLGELISNLKNNNIACGYENGKNIPPLAISSYTAAGISSTSIDLCKFATIFCNDSENKLFNDNLLKEIKKTHTKKVENKTPEQCYCLGFSKLIGNKYKKFGILAKSGVSNNHQAYLFVIPDENITIAILFSDKDYDSWFSNNERLSFDILDKVIDYFKLK